MKTWQASPGRAWIASALSALAVLHAGCSSSALDPDSCASEATLRSPITAGTAVDASVGLSPAQRRAIGIVAPKGLREAERSLRACSATVVAPGWVLTAGHCARPGETALSYRPGPARNDGPAFDSIRLVRHPELDLLLLELGEEASALSGEVTPIRLAERALNVGEAAELAGYGEQADGQRGELRFAVERVVSVDSEFVVVDGAGVTGACGGDSGGPLLAKERDDSVRVFGALSAGSADCRGIDVYAVARSDDAFFPFAPPRCGDF